MNKFMKVAAVLAAVMLVASVPRVAAAEESTLYFPAITKALALETAEEVNAHIAGEWVCDSENPSGQSYGFLFSPQSGTRYGSAELLADGVSTTSGGYTVNDLSGDYFTIRMIWDDPQWGGNVLGEWTAVYYQNDPDILYNSLGRVEPLDPCTRVDE